MINKTKYLQLKKPDGDEFYDIDVFNENADSIDGELKKNNEELAKKLSKDGNSDSNIVAFQTASKRENILDILMVLVSILHCQWMPISETILKWSRN